MRPIETQHAVDQSVLTNDHLEASLAPIESKHALKQPILANAHLQAPFLPIDASIKVKVNPAPNTSRSDRDRRGPGDDRYTILMLLRYELESWKEPDAFLQGMVDSFMEGRICGPAETKQIILRYLEVKFKMIPSSTDGRLVRIL